MARVSANDVTQLLDTKIEDSVILSSMIDTANVYIDTHLVPGAGHSDAMLKKIELYLAAHFVALTEERGTLKFSKMGDSSDAFSTSKLGEGLNATRFGQTALVLDTSGILASKGTSKLKAAFRVI